MTPEDGPINPAEICPLIPPQSGERWKSPETDLTRIFLDVLLELMVTQIPLIGKYICIGIVFGVIHKPRGQKFGYFDPLPPSWSLLLNKIYVI